MNNPQAGQSQQIQVKMSDEVLKGSYANMARVTHTKEEFVLDFMNVIPPQGVVTSRVILNPAHLKRLATALQDSISKYEQQFGKIAEATNNDSQIGFKID